MGGGAGCEADGLKFRFPKASSSPPKPPPCWAEGDCGPPKDVWRSCCGGGCGGGCGLAAYRERIDCLRSGLEGPAGIFGVEDELDGLAGGIDCGPPKKSRPSNESAAFCCFGGAGFSGGGARAPAVSVVLGRAGGSGISPNRST